MRPDIPQGWPLRVSDLIASCWSEKPEDRPEFIAIAAKLEQLLEEAKKVPTYGEENELILKLSPAIQARGANSLLCVIS